MFRFFSKSLVAFAALLVFACSGQPETEPAAAHTTALLHTVALHDVAETSAVAGTVRAAMISPLASRVMGDVIAVHVTEGDRVRAGQLLVEIDDREASAGLVRAHSGHEEAMRALAAAEAGLEAAEAQARVAAATYQRFDALRRRGSASVQEFDEVKARHDAAKAQADAARQTRDRMLAAIRGAGAAAEQAETFAGYTKIRAPIDGIVTARFVDPGAQAAPGMPLLVVEGGAPLRIEATADENVRVRAGDTADVEIAGRRFSTRITQVVASVDPGTRTSLIKLEVPEGTGTRSGSFARVLLRSGTRRALTIPASAMMQRGQLTTVFVVGEDGKAQLRLITLGERDGDELEVLSGIAAGERVVTSGLTALRDGALVRGAA